MFPISGNAFDKKSSALRNPVREIIFDTETTGFDPHNGDRLVEIGMVEMIGRVETGNSFHAYFNPQRSMPAEAEAVHGLSSQFLSDKPLFDAQVDALLEFIGDSVLVAHNAQFDMNFLNYELGLCGRQAFAADRAIDTLALARTRHPGAKHTLDALCTRYGIDRSHRVKHGALLDAQLLAQVYIELMGGRQIGLDLSVLAGVDQDQGGSSYEDAINDNARIFRPARDHAPTEAELERHASFIEKMKDPLWGVVTRTV